MFDIEKTIRQRKSIRSYENRPLSQADKAAIQAYIGLTGENIDIANLI